MEDLQQRADSVWLSIRSEAAEISEREPVLAPLLRAAVLDRRDLFDSVAWRISRKLGRNAVSARRLPRDFRRGFRRRRIDTPQHRFRHSRNPFARPRVRVVPQPDSLFQGLPVHHDPPRFALPLEQGAQGAGVLPAKPFERNFRRRHSPCGAFRRRHSARPRDVVWSRAKRSVVEDNVSILHEVTLGGTGNETATATRR